MRIPKSPPPLGECLQSLASIATQAPPNVQSQGLPEFVQQANDSYLHWHKFRFYPRPDGWDLKSAWAAVYLTRQMQMRSLPLSFYASDSHLKFWVPPQHQESLHRIDKEAGGSVVGVRTRYGIPADDERYLLSSLMEEAIASSQLEGAVTTREVAKRMLQMKKKPRDRSQQMILNNYTAIQELRELKDEDLTPDLLCHIQAVITQDTLDNPDHSGRFRNADDEPIVVSDNYGEVLHKPPSHHEIEWRLEEICDFVNEKSKPFIHPVIKAIILHFAIGFVHPFNDGNGRTARAMFYWFMLKRGYWMFEYLPISRIFLRAPAKYAKAYLYTETDGGDVTYFIHYHLAVIRGAIRDLQLYMESQQQELKAVASALDGHHELNHRQIAVISEAVKSSGSVFTIAEHAGKFNVTKATARADLFGLEEMHLLKKQRDGKRWMFLPVNRLAKALTKSLGTVVRQPGEL